MKPNIPPQQGNLWAKLDAFDLDDKDSSFTFSARLARENGWNKAYTKRAISEYKRFVFLAMSAGHPVTPSVDVDQVWHLHLTYTSSYWEDLCGKILLRPLHHGPTKGGKAEAAKFTDWYNRTLSSYEHFFAESPPEDIWPPSAIRFARQSGIRQVSERTHWVIRKPTFGKTRQQGQDTPKSPNIRGVPKSPRMFGDLRGVLLFPLALLTVLLITAWQASNSSNINGTDLFWMLLIGYIVYVVFSTFSGGGSGGGGA
jgi:hypothetical protein